MNNKLLVPLITLLSGCSLMGGQAVYEVEPIITGTGKVVCCKVKVNNTKDIDLVTVNFEVDKDGAVKMSVKEKGVNASDPASVMAEANKSMVDSMLRMIPVVPK